MNKLIDIKVNEDFFQSVIQFSTRSGATMKFDLPGEGGEVEGRFQYWAADAIYDIMDPEFGDGVEIYGYSFPDNIAPGGWYVYGADGKAYCMNDEEVPHGNGFMVDGVDLNGEPEVQFAGAVPPIRAEITVDKGYFTWTGNCMPVNYTLGDLMVNADFFQSVIQFSTPSGATKKFTLPGDGGEVEGRFQYWAADAIYDIMDPEFGDGIEIYGYSFPDNIAPGGWYVYGADGKAYCMNEEPLAAGAGFCIDGVDLNGEPELFVPSPLEAKTE